MAAKADHLRETDPRASEAQPRAGLRPPFGGRAVVWVALVIWGFCALVYGITLTFDEVPPMIAQGLPPDRFPQGLVAVMALLTGVVLIQELRKPAKKRKPIKPIVWYSLLFTIGFVALMNWLDIIIAMPVFIIAFGVLWGERRIIPLVVYAVLFSATIFWLFALVMEVVFPAGPLTNLFK